MLFFASLRRLCTTCFPRPPPLPPTAKNDASCVTGGDDLFVSTLPLTLFHELGIKQEEALAGSVDDVEATRKATADMVRVLSENPKFKQSQFFDFMNKVSTGELNFENNEVVPGIPVRCCQQMHARAPAGHTLNKTLTRYLPYSK